MSAPGRMPALAVLAVLAVLALLHGVPAPLVAQSRRCPGDQVLPGPNASPAEVSAIETLWKDAHGPGLHGGDGPMGCPVDVPQIVDSTAFAWKGVSQRFQRGWVLSGRGPSAGSAVVLIRGLGTWTTWSRGCPRTSCLTSSE